MGTTSIFINTSEPLLIHNYNRTHHKYMYIYYCIFLIIVYLRLYLMNKPVGIPKHCKQTKMSKQFSC